MAEGRATLGAAGQQQSPQQRHAAKNIEESANHFLDSHRSWAAATAVVGASSGKLFFNGVRSVPAVLLFLGLMLLQGQQRAAAVLFELRSGTHQCFFVPVNIPGWTIQGRFEQFVGEKAATLSIDGPVPSPNPKQAAPTAAPQVLFSSSDEQSSFKIAIKTKGVYRLCAKNNLNYTQTVTLNFHLMPPFDGEEAKTGEGASGANAVDMSNLVLNTHTDALKTTTNRVLELASGLFDQQSNSMARLVVYSELNATTRNRATFWKVLQMVVQIVLSGIHVYAVRSRFEVKTIV